MTGHRPFQTLRDAMSPERRAHNAAAIEEPLKELTAQESQTAEETLALMNSADRT